jgi:hypothetical protein
MLNSKSRLERRDFLSIVLLERLGESGGFTKSSQIQNHLFIKPNAQIRCSTG